MERFPVELLYVLGFVALVLFNYIAQRRARQRQQDEVQPPEPPAEHVSVSAPSPAADVDDDPWGRAPASAPAPAPEALVARPAAPPTPRRMHPARALLNDKRDLRRAVVLMMILGPCRAQEPPER